MTTGQARGIKQPAINDASVAEYLQACPDFFERNGALLGKLRLPHLRDAGSTVSLVERQVEVLRERNQSLERKLKELVDVARANDALADRIHRLSQRLIRAHTLAETVAALEASLREDFDARNSVLVLFLEQARTLDIPPGRFLRAIDAADAAMKTFESLLQSGKPRCGQIRDLQRDLLFGKDSIEIGSVALTPLGAKGALGILAIGASDAERFHPGMSTEFLTRIGELAAQALTR
ncbi:MAG TPA: DUF484 family protein [Steroidobacteraceae bacterium]|nr:DUF484 family protein [Steroidobacteraceae bacterium]